MAHRYNQSNQQRRSQGNRSAPVEETKPPFRIGRYRDRRLGENKGKEGTHQTEDVHLHRDFDGIKRALKRFDRGVIYHVAD